MSTTSTSRLLVVLPQPDKPRSSIVQKGNLNIEEDDATSALKNQSTSYTPNGNLRKPTVSYN